MVRPRKSAAEKRLTGTQRKGRPNDDEVVIDAAAPDAPDWLEGVALDLWHMIVPELTEAGIIGRVDGHALARYCILSARWRDAETHIAAHGSIVKSPSGYPCQNPSVSIANKLATELGRLEQQFGMTPAARSTKITKANPKQGVDSLKLADAI